MQRKVPLSAMKGPHAGLQQHTAAGQTPAASFPSCYDALQEPADLEATSEGEESSGSEDEPVEDANPQALVPAGGGAYRWVGL